MNGLFIKALPIIDKIEKSGYEAYFVGGSVRDVIMERAIHDIDIASSATPEEIKRIFPNTIDVGIEHGTILVIFEGVGYEVTTFRSESNYVDYRRPENVSFIRSLEEDLKRRDFTMNAIAMDKEGQLIDPFGGQNDIGNKQIVTVGKAEERFQEDALRLLRAARFVSQLGFSLERKTGIALKEHAPLLRHIAVERIAAEMTKILNGAYKQKALQLVMESGLFSYLPSILNDRNVLCKLITLNVQRLKADELWALALFYVEGDQPAELLRTWRLPARTIKRVNETLSFLHGRVGSEWDNYMLYKAGLEMAIAVETTFQVMMGEDNEDALQSIMKQYERLPLKSRKQLVVTGKDILSWANREAGPWVNHTFIDIEQAILNGKLANDHESIRRWIECQLLSENN